MGGQPVDLLGDDLLGVDDRGEFGLQCGGELLQPVFTHRIRGKRDQLLQSVDADRAGHLAQVLAPVCLHDHPAAGTDLQLPRSVEDVENFGAAGLELDRVHGAVVGGQLELFRRLLLLAVLV